MKNSDLEVLEHVANWLADGQEVNLVTLVSCSGSAPRPVGSMAAIRGDGAIIGSVSGGCIEKELTETLGKKSATGLIRHSISSDQAVRYGLSCGGSLELLFETAIDKVQVDELITILRNREQICRKVKISSGIATLESVSKGQGFEFDGRTMKRVFGPSWRLLVIGAGQLSRYVAEMGIALDYDVVICEPREHFSKTWGVQSVVVDTSSPDDAVRSFASDPNSAVLALTHDPNLDDLALMEALNSDSFYVGALGSRKNHEKRCKRLLDVFELTSDQVSKLHGPIGLDIGGKSPAEIAVSIMAQITQVRRLEAVNMSDSVVHLARH